MSVKRTKAGHGKLVSRATSGDKLARTVPASNAPLPSKEAITAARLLLPAGIEYQGNGPLLNDIAQIIDRAFAEKIKAAEKMAFVLGKVEIYITGEGDNNPHLFVTEALRQWKECQSDTPKEHHENTTTQTPS